MRRVMIDGPCLVLRVKMLNEDMADIGIGGKLEVKAKEMVVDAILDGEHGLVLKHTLEICPCLPSAAVVCQRHIVRAEGVAS